MNDAPATNDEERTKEFFDHVKKVVDKVSVDTEFTSMLQVTDPKVIRLLAIDYVITSVAKDSMGMLPEPLIKMMASNEITKYALSEGYTQEEIEKYNETDIHDYLTIESLLEQCVDCEKKAECQRYQDYLKAHPEATVEVKPEDKSEESAT